ncbi:MAG: ATP-binding cassette domain-containing protein, partial [Brevinematia bacterium]
IASALSGGEKRRLEVARMIAIEPNFLLLDEPFTGIDPIAINDIQSIVKRLKEDKGIGVLITDHNVRETLKIVDRAYIIYQGQILIEGDADTLINDPKAKEIYLGHTFEM